MNGPLAFVFAFLIGLNLPHMIEACSAGAKVRAEGSPENMMSTVGPATAAMGESDRDGDSPSGPPPKEAQPVKIIGPAEEVSRRREVIEESKKSLPKEDQKPKESVEKK